MNDKPITLIVTVYPPKKAVRKVLVSGAPEGEMPVLMAGLFQERHTLLDTVYAAVSKRDPQIVTLKESKPSKIDKRGHKVDEPGEEEEPGNREPDEDDTPSDQLDSDDVIPADSRRESIAVVGGNPEPVSPITGANSDDENLPAIEGDFPPPVTQERGELEGGHTTPSPASIAQFEAQLNDEVTHGQQD